MENKFPLSRRSLTKNSYICIVKVANFIRRVADLFYLKPFRKVIPHRTFLYFVGGAMNTVLGWVLYFVLFNYVTKPIGYFDLGFTIMSPHITALFIQFPITFATGFWLNRNVAFCDSNLRGFTQVARYLLSVAGAFLLNYALLKILVEVCRIVAPVSKILTDCIVAIYSYLMQRHFSFKVIKNRPE